MKKLLLSLILISIGVYTITRQHLPGESETILAQALAFAGAVKGEWYWHLANPYIWVCIGIIGGLSCLPFLFTLLVPGRPLPEFDERDHKKRS